VSGRHRVGDDGSVDFDHPGVTISARFIGSSKVQALMSQVGIVMNTFVVYCDGMWQKGPADLHTASFSTSGWSAGVKHLVPLCEGLDPEREHTVTILKATEAQWNAAHPEPNHVSFHKFLGSHDFHILAAPKRYERRLEFLGDSITAGFCNMCGREMYTPKNQNFAFSWPKLVCEDLGAECHVAAWSSFGMVQGETLMSDIWLRTLASTPSGCLSDPHGTIAENRWPFKSWKPDALIINLGTNDRLSTTGISKIPDYNRTYLGLVKSAAAAYGAETRFFLACGPMLDDYCHQVHWVIQQAQTAGIKAHFLDHRNFDCPESCCGHPSAKSDRAMAKATITQLKDVLDWKDKFMV